MPTLNEVPTSAMSNLDNASTYLAGPEDHLPAPVETPETTGDVELHLVKPENTKSRFWTHFLRYDVSHHPDKRTTARCTLCGKEISVKQGTGGLKNHMRFKHPEENAVLMHEGDGEPPNSNHHQMSPVNAAAATLSVGTPSSVPPHKKPRISVKQESNPYIASVSSTQLDADRRSAENAERRSAERRLAEKHLMEMWSRTRKEVRELRTELKEEEDEAVVRELESDIRVLTRKKAEYAELMGLPKDDVPTSEEV